MTKNAAPLKIYSIGDIYALIDSVLDVKPHCVLAIDGRCASGKTTAASKIAEKYSARLIHTDDFFLPLEKRTAERLSEPGGNVDYERFFREVISPLNDASLTYGRFDCSKMSISEARTLPLTQLTVIEGAYSMHPYFGDYADISVFFTCIDEVRFLRIEKRNGADKLDVFKKKWIPLEEKYFSHFGIPSRCSVVFDTSEEQQIQTQNAQ